jgi:hypothetical protein
MPEIRFTDEELKSVQRAQQEVNDTFETTFGRFREWLDDSDMQLIKAHRLAIVRRDAFFRLSLKAAAESLGLMHQDEQETFVEEGFDASIDYASDPLGLFDPPREEIWAKLKLTPQDEERGAEIHKEILERYGLTGPTKIVMAGQESPTEVAIDLMHFRTNTRRVLEREGLDCREDALSNLLCEERGR